MTIEQMKKQSKNLLRHLPQFVSEHAEGLTLSHCQELVARIHGYPNWHAAAQRHASDSGDQAPPTPVDRSDDDKTEMSRHLRKLREFVARRNAAHEEGLPALQRLFQIANGDSGQCRHIAAFLLALYNGSRFPFDMTDLRAVDTAIFEDCMRVLRMDSSPRQEVHTYFVDGGRKFEQLAERWAIADMRRVRLICKQITQYGVRSFDGEEKLCAEIEHALASTWPREQD